MKHNPKIVAAFFRECRIPEPQTEWPVCEGRKFRFDYAWPLLQVAMEIEGGCFTRGAHGSVSGILRDIEKYNLATLNGWKVLRVLPQNLLTSETAAMLRKLMCL